MRLFVLCLFVALVGSVSAETDWGQVAREGHWEWPHADPSLLSAAVDDISDEPYEVAIVRYPWKAATERFKEPDAFGCFFDFKVMREGKILFQRPAHQATVFRIRNSRCYFAAFSPVECGCTIICFDLDAQKLLWETKLKAAGAVAHSIYRNRVSLAVLTKGVVQVYGWEDAGKYVEYLDLDTGKTLAHHVFE